MYTNIKTDHAIEIIELWFELHDDEIPVEFPRKSVLLSIKRLISNNAFTFGSFFYIQDNGTSMGTSCACVHATIYYSPSPSRDSHGPPSTNVYTRSYDDVNINADNDDNGNTNIIIQTKNANIIIRLLFCELSAILLMKAV